MRFGSSFVAVAVAPLRFAVPLVIACALVPACSSTSSSNGAGSDAGAGGADGGPLACPPADVSGFTPPSYHSANPPKGSCTQALIAEFYTACLAPASSEATCAPFGASGDALHTACSACILSKDTDAHYGPLVQHAGTVSLNISGCIELKDAQNGLACAKAYQASEDCDDAACATKCPVTDDASFAAYKACTQAAAGNGCKQYTHGIDCAAAEADGGPAASCLVGSTFKDLFDAIVPVFCLGAGGGD